MTLYITGSAGRVYHIVLERGRSYTICGLKVVTPKSIVTELPQNGVLCKHCERLQTELPNNEQDS